MCQQQLDWSRSEKSFKTWEPGWMGFGHLTVFPSRFPNQTARSWKHLWCCGEGFVYWGSANYLYCEAPSLPPGCCPRQRALFCFNHAHFPIFSNGRLSRNQTEWWFIPYRTCPPCDCIQWVPLLYFSLEMEGGDKMIDNRNWVFPHTLALIGWHLHHPGL